MDFVRTLCLGIYQNNIQLLRSAEAGSICGQTSTMSTALSTFDKKKWSSVIRLEAMSAGAKGLRYIS